MKGSTEISRWPVPRKRRKKKEIREIKNVLLSSFEKAPWVSEIQDKGDLFYIEPYIERDSGNAFTKQTNGQPIKENNEDITKDKKQSSKKLFDIIPKIKKNKKLQEVNKRSTDKSLDYNAIKERKKDVKLRVNPPRIGPYKRDDVESVLGIIPSGLKYENDVRYQDGVREGKIIIAGFTPTGPAIVCHELEIGDTVLALNGLELNTGNVNAMLGAIPGAMEVTLRIEKGFSPAIPVSQGGFLPNDNHLLKIISGKTSSYKANDFTDISHGVMFLSLGVSSEQDVDSDILFQFPKDSASKKLHSLRGIFLTLADLLSSVTGSTAKSTSVLIDGNLVQIGYKKIQQELFILALPSNRVPLSYMNSLMENLDRLLCMMFGSLNRAFCDDCNTLRLEHFFSLLFEFVLGTKCIFSNNNDIPDPLESFFNCLEGVKWMGIPSESKVHIDTCLNELEANDCEWADELFTTRRQYFVIGSCLFYKGFLIGNHLATDDLVDVALYCKFHCLFSTSEQQKLSQVVIWREVFLTRERKGKLEPSFTSSTGPRTFLLIVGLKHSLFCIILESGIISRRANGNPGPDPYYIDQAKNVLFELEHLDIPSVCEARFQAPSSPPTATADHLAVLGKTSNSSVEKLANESKTKFPGSNENLRSPGVEETDSIYSESSAGGNLPVHSRRRNSNGSDGSKTSLGSGGVRTLMNRKIPSTLTLATLRKSPEIIADLNFNYQNKLSAGDENTIFHYVSHNVFRGIILSPFQNGTGRGKLHDAVLENFNKSCLKIRKHFLNNSSFNKDKQCPTQSRFSSTAPETVHEMGIQFCVFDGKRHEPSLKYWVKGRLTEGARPTEFYVCYQDSAAQSMVELAFKLGFGSMV